MNLDDTHGVINKITKKIYYMEGSELRFVCEMLPNINMQWISNVIRMRHLWMIVRGHAVRIIIPQFHVHAFAI